MLGSRKNFVLDTLFLIFLSTVLEITAAPLAKSSDTANKPPAVYRRFIRRRPPVYAEDEFMEEVVEEFYVRKKPPKFALSDADIELIITCDFNPEYKDCYKLKSKDQHPMNTTPRIINTRPTPPLEDFPLLPNISVDEDEKVDKDVNEEEEEEPTDNEIEHINENDVAVDDDVEDNIAEDDDVDEEDEEPTVEVITTDYPWTGDKAITTESDANLPEGSADGFYDTESQGEDW